MHHFILTTPGPVAACAPKELCPISYDLVLCTSRHIRVSNPVASIKNCVVNFHHVITNSGRCARRWPRRWSAIPAEYVVAFKVTRGCHYSGLAAPSYLIDKQFPLSSNVREHIPNSSARPARNERNTPRMAS